MPLTPTSTNDGIVSTEVAAAIENTKKTEGTLRVDELAQSLPNQALAEVQIDLT
ncbi:MAG: hypothetical protein WBD58_18385 [Geitlerinemataceae cyanobacterium]